MTLTTKQLNDLIEIAIDGNYNYYFIALKALKINDDTFHNYSFDGETLKDFYINKLENLQNEHNKIGNLTKELFFERTTILNSIYSILEAQTKTSNCIKVKSQFLIDFIKSLDIN